MVEFDKPDFVDFIQVLSDHLKGRADNNFLVIPPPFGKGYCWAEKLPCGITVLISDCTFHQDLSVYRKELEEQDFILHFNELTLDADIEHKKEFRRKAENDIQSYVKITHTLVPGTFIFPAGIHVRSVRFNFNKSHLAGLVGKQAIDEVLTNYFPLLVQKNSLDPIATDYRVMLDELWNEKIDQPLRINYIQNRILMLLEKFIVKVHAIKPAEGRKAKRSDDETVRLMKVEALLVRNFAMAPPTIDELSRISAMSPTKLKNDFKTLYGLPIYEYYQKNRMIKAKSLLLLSKYSIKEVGMMVGYSNLSHFANTFKKEFGYLPSEIAAKDGVLVYNREEG